MVFSFLDLVYAENKRHHFCFPLVPLDIPAVASRPPDAVLLEVPFAFVDREYWLGGSGHPADALKKYGTDDPSSHFRIHGFHLDRLVGDGGLVAFGFS